MSTRTSIYVLINVHASIYVHHVFVYVFILVCPTMIEMVTCNVVMTKMTMARPIWSWFSELLRRDIDHQGHCTLVQIYTFSTVYHPPWQIGKINWQTFSYDLILINIHGSAWYIIDQLIVAQTSGRIERCSLLALLKNRCRDVLVNIQDIHTYSR